MYQSRYRPQTSYAPRVSNAALLGQVLGITGVGFLVTTLAAYLFRDLSQGAALLAFIAGFVLLISMQVVRENERLAILLFYAFTFLEGMGLAPTIARYVALDPTVVVNAAGTTGAGMLVLGGVAYIGSVDWRRFSGIGTVLLVALLIVGVISMFVRFLHPGTYAWLTLGVFTLWTLIDFSRIRAGGDGATPVQLAVSIYLDAINIFLALLRIFGLRSSRD